MTAVTGTMYPKARLDALTDGLFGVAMTLLALDIRLPADFEPSTAPELLSALLALLPKFIPYTISFLVLGLRWLAGVQIQFRSETVSPVYARWWLFYLFLITCVPFTTVVIGRFPHFAPAVWLYAGNTALIAAVSMQMMRLMPDVEQGRHVAALRVAFSILLGLSLMALIISFFAPSIAIWALALVVLTPAQYQWMRGRKR
jgi:uncharacterized membrane protein